MVIKAFVRNYGYTALPNVTPHGHLFPDGDDEGVWFDELKRWSSW